MTQWINESMSEKGVYKTAPASPGLLNILTKRKFFQSFSFLKTPIYALWCLKFSKYRPSGPMLSISRNVRLSVRPSVCPSVCLSVRVFTFEVPLKRLFAPTSQSQMSNIFRDSESFGKSNAKKWSQIWTFLFESCLKSPHKKKVFFLLILPDKTWWKPRFLWSKGLLLILKYL